MYKLLEEAISFFGVAFIFTFVISFINTVFGISNEFSELVRDLALVNFYLLAVSFIWYVLFPSRKARDARKDFFSGDQ